MVLERKARREGLRAIQDCMLRAYDQDWLFEDTCRRSQCLKHAINVGALDGILTERLA